MLLAILVSPIIIFFWALARFFFQPIIYSLIFLPRNFLIASFSNDFEKMKLSNANLQEAWQEEVNNEKDAYINWFKNWNNGLLHGWKSE